MCVCNYILELLGRLMVMMWIWEILHWSVAQNSVYMFQVVKKLDWGHETWETVLRDDYKVFRREHEVVRWQQVWREALFQGRTAKLSCLWSSWPPLRQRSFCAMTGHMGPLMTILQEGVTPPPHFIKGERRLKEHWSKFSSLTGGGTSLWTHQSPGWLTQSKPSP